MNKFQVYLNRFSFYIGTFLLGGVSVYIAFKLWEKYQAVKDANKLFQVILNYKIQESNNLTIYKIFILISVLVIGLKLAKFVSYKVVDKLLKQTKLNKGGKAAFENLSYYAFVCLSCIIAMNIAEVPLTVFTLFGGALAIGLGFGSQNILSNFISGIILQVEQPVKVGDIIEIEGTIGTIENIGGRSTKIISSNNTHMILPNSYLLDKKLVNWTFQDNILRSKIEISLDYNSDPVEIEKVITKVIDDFENVMQFPSPKIHLNEFGTYSLNYIIYFWIPIQGTMDKASIESTFRINLLKAFKQANIKIPVPLSEVKIQRIDT